MKKLIYLFIFLICVSIVHANFESVSVEGYVLDIDGNPITDGRVMVDDRTGDYKEYEVAEDGKFIIDSIPVLDEGVNILFEKECTKGASYSVTWSDQFNKLQLDHYVLDDPKAGQVIPDEERFKFFTEPHIDLGNVELYPSSPGHIDSDEPVTVSYFQESKLGNEDFGGSGVGLAKKDQITTGAILYGYKTKVMLENVDGKEWMYELTSNERCNAVRITKRGDKITHELCDAPWCQPLSGWQKFTRWLSGLF
jgi:hypothetical protein